MTRFPKNLLVEVASGVVSVHDLKLSAVNNLAFIDFLASSLTDNNPVTSGSLTLAQTRLSTINGAAFVWLTSVDLTSYQDGTYYIVIKDSSKNKIGGWISSIAPSGESVDAELLTSWSNNGIMPFETFSSSDYASFSASNTSSTGNAVSNTISSAAGKLTKFVYTLSYTTGLIYNIRSAANTSGTAPRYEFAAAQSAGTYTQYIWEPGATQLLMVHTSAPTVTFEMTGMTWKQVTAPPSTGALIVSSRLGGTRNFSVVDTNFNGNDTSGYTYEIYSAAVLPRHLGQLLTLRSSGTSQLWSGWIKAAGTGETLSGELLTNGSMETGTPPSGWTATVSQISGEAERTGGSGSQSLGVLRSGAGAAAYQTIVAPLGMLLKGTGWFKIDAGNLACFNYDTPTTSGFLITGSGESWTEFSGYSRVGVANTNVMARSQTTLGTKAYYDDLSVKPVITPAATGVTIVSSKGGSTQNWAGKPTTGASGCYNDILGYTYQIYQEIGNCPIVLSGSIVRADCRLDLSTTNAFVWLNGVDLSPYQDGRHLIAVYDISGRAVFGYISSTPPAGESLGDERLSNTTFDSDTTGWTTTDCTIASVAGGQSNNCLELTRTGGTSQSANQNVATGCAVSSLMRLSIYVKAGTSGNESFRVSHTNVASLIWSTTCTGAWVEYIGYAYAFSAGTNLLVINKYTATDGTMLFDEVSYKQVTDPPNTGARIVSTKGGSTRAFTYKHNSFQGYDSSLSYKVFYIGQ